MGKQKSSFIAVSDPSTRPPTGRNPSLIVKHQRGLFTDLPSLPLYTILTYDFCAFRKYLAVCPCWYRALISAFDELCNRIEHDFTMKYHQYLLFNEAHLDSSVISFCDKKGLRVDRVIECELLKKAVGSTLCIAYKYRYYSEKTTYRVAFKTDAVKRGRRVMWIHKDEENGTTEAQAIVQSCEEDAL